MESSWRLFGTFFFQRESGTRDDDDDDDDDDWCGDVFGDDADEEEKELPPTPTASLWPSNAADGDVRGANTLAGTLDFDAVAIPGDLDWLDGFLRVDEEEEKEEEEKKKKKKK